MNKFLSRMEAHRKRLVTLKAKIEMAKYNSQLDSDDDLTEGKIIYVAGKSEREIYVRLDWIKPEESLSIVKDAYTLYRPRLKQVYIGKVDKAKNSAKAGNALSFMNMSSAQLKKNFTFTLLSENERVKNGTSTVHIELTPKIKTNYKTAEVWIDTDGMPIQIKVTEHNNDSTTILLSNLVKNEQIDVKVLTVEYPSTIKPIKN